MVNRQALVLFSGGMDSYIHLMWAINAYGLDNVKAVWINFNQRYNHKELTISQKLCDRYKIPLLLKLDELTWLGSGEKSDGHIPFRNTFMLLLVAAIGNGNTDIVFGMLENESSEDKNKRYIRSMQKLINSQTQSNIYHGKQSIRIIVPFADKTKTEMLAWYLSKYTDTESILDTIGCYNPSEGKQCGGCISCFNRWVALVNNGLVESYSGSNRPWIWFKDQAVEAIENRSITKNKISAFATIKQLLKKRKYFLEIRRAYKETGRLAWLKQSVRGALAKRKALKEKTVI